ncbi:aldo/keto reductase [soil metagenome]
MKVPSVKLNDTLLIPQIGLGLWQVKDVDEFNAAFNAAILAGYRHFDSAQVYRNEQMLGAAWTELGLKRDELFITTKISVENFGTKRTIASFHTSLKKLKTDYVDLLLLHFPVTIVRKKSWLALEKLQSEGKVRSIGVSNYTVRHLKELKEYANVVPAVNQVELHVFLQQPELIKYCQTNGITVEAYSPLAHAKEMNEQVIVDIAAKHNKTYAQIMLRWCIEQNLIVLPKSVTSSRIQENIHIFDFELDKDDQKKLAGLNKDMRTCWDPTLVP